MNDKFTVRTRMCVLLNRKYENVNLQTVSETLKHKDSSNSDQFSRLTQGK
jgi:hypothetical protein